LIDIKTRPKRSALHKSRDTAYSAAAIRERISAGKASITGGFSNDEARDLAIVLKVGSFPVPVEIIEFKTLDEKIWLGSV